MRIFLKSTVLLASLLSLTGGARAEEASKQVTFFFTGYVHGSFEPCG